MAVCLGPDRDGLGANVVGQPLRAPDIAAYAVGSIGTGVFSSVPTVLLLYYCTETLNIPAALATLAVFVPKVWAILWDPIVGAWSDRARSPFGRRRPFLVIGAIGVFCAFVTLFSTPLLPVQGAFLWVASSYFALATLYSVFAVPYVSLPAVLGPSPASRATLVSARITLATLGVLAGAAIAPVLVERFGGGRPGYGVMAWILASVCAVAMLGPIAILRGRDDDTPTSDDTSFLRRLTAALGERRLRMLGASYILQIAASGAFSATVPYLVTRVAGRPEGEIGTVLGLMFSTAIAATPLWSWLGRRAGEVRVNAAALVTYAVVLACIGIACMARAPWPVLLALFAAAGAPFAATQVLPFAIQANIAHRASRHAGRSLEGAFAGAWTAAEKLGLALGPLLTGLALAVIGEDVATGASAFVALVPPVLLFASLAPLAAVDSK